MADEILNDFGFCFVDENELESLQVTTQELASTSATLEEAQARLDRLYNAIQPLLTNLKANPEKEFIRWVNRAQKVEEFSDILDKIYHGDNS